MVSILKRLLGKVPFWVWPALALAAWGLTGRIDLKHERADRAAEHQAQAEAIDKQKREAAATEAEWKGRLDEQKRTFDATRRVVDADHAAAVASLHNRPAHRADMPSPAAAACAGASPAALAAEDATVVVGFAAEFDKLRIDYMACRAWIETVKGTTK